jgi:hypothetical protein
MPRLQIGFTRGRVYFPIRNEDGSIAGFVGYADGQLKMPPAADRDQRGQTETCEKRPRSSRGFFILRFGLGLESTLEFHQLRRRWRLAEHLSRAFLRLTSNQPRCCQLRRSLLPRCSEPRPSHQLEHQFVQMKRY